ncbi:MAG TPA: OsmC family protein [Spirochaetia bacterium]|nr:OsmC family protein [Spirochaetia bacterium]
MDNTYPTEKRFDIVVRRESDSIANVSAHGILLRLSMKGTDPTLGLTAPETVIAGYGACLMTNLGKAAKKLGVPIDDARIEFSAAKRTDPLGIKNVRCKITVKSGASDEQVRAVFEKASTDGTATNAIHEGFRAEFELARE